MFPGNTTIRNKKQLNRQQKRCLFFCAKNCLVKIPCLYGQEIGCRSRGSTELKPPHFQVRYAAHKWRVVHLFKHSNEAHGQLLTTEVASLMMLIIQSPIQTTRVYRSLSGPNVIPCGMLPEMPGSYPRFRRYRFYGRLQGTLT